jgi:predicted 3-demethylubiquinone-9 3-methyltransferase (glyoxalase superfamily)
VEEAEAALRLAADTHPNRPTLIIKRSADMDSDTQEEVQTSSFSFHIFDASFVLFSASLLSSFQMSSSEQEEEDGVDLE